MKKNIKSHKDKTPNSVVYYRVATAKQAQDGSLEEQIKQCACVIQTCTNMTLKDKEP